ncbi:Cytochrome P450 76C4 [Linum grandiflorum]
MTYFEESLLKIVLPLLLLCFLLRNYWRRERKQEVRRKLPPGPKPWPILGNLLHVGSKLHVDFARLAEIHGPIVSLRFGNMIVAVCSTPEAAGEILKVHELLAAVSDTTSATMEWAMAELLKNPKTIATARCSCVKETLRLHPPAPLLLPRRAAKDCQVMNYTIPKGSQVFVNVWAIARDPHYWEDPSQFNPERFLKGSINDEVDYKGNHFEYLPFGSGRRICSGMSMAMRKVQLVVATLVHEFDWSLPMGMVAEDLDMDEGYGVTLIKANPLVAIPTPRS